MYRTDIQQLYEHFEISYNKKKIIPINHLQSTTSLSPFKLPKKSYSVFHFYFHFP